MSLPLLISVAPNGARRTRSDHPALPLTPAQLGEDAQACESAGARLYHLHVRDETGKHTLSPYAFHAAIDSIEARVGDRLIIQMTTESGGQYDREQQMAIVRQVRPQAASFALREFISLDDPDPAVRRFFDWVAEAEMLTQVILYKPEEAQRLRVLIERGGFSCCKLSVLFVLGRWADGPPSGPAALDHFRGAWNDIIPWSVCAFGPSEIQVAAAAIDSGGHVRVGFENNCRRLDDSLLAGNAEQVAAVAALAHAAGRALIDVPGARRLHRCNDAPTSRISCA